MTTPNAPARGAFLVKPTGEINLTELLTNTARDRQGAHHKKTGERAGFFMAISSVHNKNSSLAKVAGSMLRQAV